jgi:hypothetical protein
VERVQRLVRWDPLVHDHRCQLAPETTLAGCRDCAGGFDGGDNCPDPEDVPEVEDPAVELLVADEVVLWLVEVWPGSALLR